MDDRRDRAEYAIEKKFGPAECECDGTCDLAYKIGETVYHYKDVWAKIEDKHYPECPTSTQAKKRLKSTLCLCGEIEKANRSAQECLRCHNLAEACKCGAKAQLV